MKQTCLLSALVFLLCLPWNACADDELRGFDEENGYQYVSLGSFPQTAEGGVQPILWRVLSAGEESVYLLSEYILFGNRVDPDDARYQETGGQFNQTEIFRLLNGPFSGKPISPEEQEALHEIERLGYAYMAETSFFDAAFTADEQSMLWEDEELGHVFLPSAEDLKNPAYGFSSSADRQAFGTPYAHSTGLYEYSNGTSPYWTRSPSVSYPYAARCTKVDGDLGYIRCVVMNEGCRPAVRLKTSELRITGGTGTLNDPFTFAR